MVNHAKAITLLFASFGQEGNKQRMKIYMQMLKDIPENILQRVVEKTIYESKFLPSIAELVEACRSLTATANGVKEVPDWNEAWSEIFKNMHATGWFNTPKWSHPVIEQTVNNYGWNLIHTVEEKDLHTMQAQLRRMYDESAKRYLENMRNNIILQNEPAIAQSKTLELVGGANG